MRSRAFSSWGNVVRVEHTIVRLRDRHEPFPALPPAITALPFGNGRSYGDSCLNAGAGLVPTRHLDRFIEFDAQNGVLTCEAGVLFDEILRLIVPRGWFVPVTPGTRFVTVGGAIANDVHGKNHHGAGTFGRHVECFELLRSDGVRLLCSATENAEWFAATLGGLGLTGIVTWARIRLRAIAGPMIDVETVRFANLDEFLEICAESDDHFDYTVAWIDCLGRGKRLGRGLLQRARHSPAAAPIRSDSRQITVPFTPPFSVINGVSLRAFNTAYYHRQPGRVRRGRVHYESFFYPLDSILNWNRLYGPRGLYQYQCVVPRGVARDAVAALLGTIAGSRMGSFLSVLKQFGNLLSPGMLSFPREGLTLALDFPNRGERLACLFRNLDAIVLNAGGRLYPAKDGRMPGSLFRNGYPRWAEFSRYIDPRCSSTFWRRIMEDECEGS